MMMVDELPPSESLQKGIEDLIQDQFPMMEHGEKDAPAASASQSAAPSAVAATAPDGQEGRGSVTSTTGPSLQGELNEKFNQTSIFFHIVENMNFQRFFHVFHVLCTLRP